MVRLVAAGIGLLVTVAAIGFGVVWFSPAAQDALMRRVVGGDMGVKASGGVRNREDVEAMIAAGANRIGASASVAIVTGKSGGPGY